MPDGDPLIGQLLIQLLLIALNAVFACAEIAVISINDAKLERLAATGDKRAVRLLALTNQPAKFLATIQVGITLAGFLGSAFAADNFADRLVTWALSIGIGLPASTMRAIAVVLITMILSYFTLVLGELVPKRVAMQRAEQLGLGMSGMITFISKVFAPLVWLLTRSTNLLLRLIGIDPNAQDDEVTEEEIRMMVDVGSEKGTIDATEKDIIHAVFEFDNKTAEEVMTHRTDVAFLWMEEDDAVWEKTILANWHENFPICGETTDDIIGVLRARDYFRLTDRDRREVMRRAVLPVQFVPESVRTDVLFQNMRKGRNHFAVVLDAHGGVSGVVTINDLLEELVGDLDDDATEPIDQPEIERLDENTFLVSGSAPLDEVAFALAVKLPAQEYDTFADLVFGELGTVPDDGQQPAIEAYGLAINVLEIREHRMESAKVCKLPVAAKENGKA